MMARRMTTESVAFSVCVPNVLDMEDKQERGQSKAQGEQRVCVRANLNLTSLHAQRACTQRSIRSKSRLVDVKECSGGYLKEIEIWLHRTH